MPSLGPHEFTLDSQTYIARGPVRRVQINDWPRPVPSTGAQEIGQRYLRNMVQLKDIKDAFGHQVELRWRDHERDGVVTIDHLADSNVDTRWGPLYAPPTENNPTNPTDAGISVWAGVANAVDRPSAVAAANRNPKAAVYFTGTTNSGLFTWRVDDVAANNYDNDALRWSGTAWGEEATITAASANEREAGHDMIIHKGALCYWVDGTVSNVFRSTDGDTFAAMTNGPGSHDRGSRLLDAGNRLYAFNQDRTTAGAFDVMSTDDNGATAWTARSTNHPGTLRDVVWYYDWVTESEEIFIMTANDIYTYDTTNFALRHRIHLAYRGRAMLPFFVNGQRALLLFLDAGRVYALLTSGAVLDISPGGAQGMPSGKDFGPAAEGMVCVASTGQFAYALWSGTDTGGTNQRPLILAFDGAVDVSGGKVRSAGWHFIWRDSATRQPWAARYIAFDPVSGDLLAGVQRAVSEDTTLIRLQDIEVNPELQATLDRSTAAQTFTTPRLDFGSPGLSSTIWDVFLHTSGLGTNTTLATAFRTNGSTGAYTTVATATADRVTHIFPDNAAGAVGTNFRDIQFQFTLDPELVTTAVRIYSIDGSFSRIPDVRWLYIIDIDIDATVAVRGGGTEDLEVGVRDTLETTLDSKTKVTLAYGDRTGLAVLPIPEHQAQEVIAVSLDPVRGLAYGPWTIYLAEV